MLVVVAVVGTPGGEIALLQHQDNKVTQFRLDINMIRNTEIQIDDNANEYIQYTCLDCVQYSSVSQVLVLVK